MNAPRRRWNGWGLTESHYPLPDSAQAYLDTTVGKGSPLPDASLEDVIAGIPPTRLPPHDLISTEPQARLMHARGQSLPDWIALRSGDIPAFPDGVAYPSNAAEVRALIAYCKRNNISLISYGGGTSVVGHINPPHEGPPILTVDVQRLNAIKRIDAESRLAWIGAGATGPFLEAQLNAAGFTLGHFPQSFEFSTLGGWIATRSSGQQSYHYGRIENQLAGVEIETAAGPWCLPPLPASAAGPDLKQLVLGSEGRIGIITEAVVRVQPSPQVDAFYAAFFPDWESGAAAVRETAQSGVSVSMLRLSNAIETETTLQLSGKPRLVGLANFGLNALGYQEGRSLLVYAVTGTRETALPAKRQVNAILRRHHGILTGSTIGGIWRKSRFRSPYLRNTLWDKGYALDTLETAVPWSAVMQTAYDMDKALRDTMQSLSMQGLIFTHLSHIYPDGASIYTTFLFPFGREHAETLHRWRQLKTTASHAILANNGTISHQHGVGVDHAPYLSNEKGAPGIGVIRAANSFFDPDGIFNPGKLIA